MTRTEWRFAYSPHRVGQTWSGRHSMPRRRRRSLVLASALGLQAVLWIVVAAPAPAQEVCYAAADDFPGSALTPPGGHDATAEDLLTRINRSPTATDPATNEENVGDGTGSFNIEALAFKPGTQELYAGNGPEFGKLDLTTGNYSMIGEFGSGTSGPGAPEVPFDDIDGLGFDGPGFDSASGILYATERLPNAPDLLLQVDAATGAHVENAFGPDADYVEIAPIMGLEDVDDITIDVNAPGRPMYAVANQAGFNDRLIRIDKTTGATTDVGPLQIANDMEGLSISPQGDLFGITGKANQAPEREALYDISKTTGAASNPRPVDNGNDYEAVACFVGGDLGISITKTGPALAHVDDTVTYTMQVQLTQAAPLGNVTVTDPNCNSAPSLVGKSGGDQDDLLEPNEVWTYTCPHAITGSDADPLPNTATARGTDAAGRVATASDSHSVDIIHPAISLVKTANPVSGSPGDQVTYTYVVLNTGDTGLTAIKVDDDILGHIGDIASLDPGQSATLTKASTLPGTAGSLTNTGTAVGRDQLGKEVSARDAETVSSVLGRTVARTLPVTGPEGVPGLLALATSLLVSGTALLRRGRRRMVPDLGLDENGEDDGEGPLAPPRRKRRPRLGLLAGGLIVSAVVSELRKAPKDRTWNGRVAGFVPYDLRRPTVARFRQAWWNPKEKRLFLPTAFGVGWAVNLARVARIVKKGR